MKKVNLYILLSLTLGVLSFPLEGASSAQTSDPKDVKSSSQQVVTDDDDDDDDDFDDGDDDDDFDDIDDDDEDYYDIIERNQIDNTDTLAIPLDDSEVEDEEEINKAEGRNTFKLPQAR